MKNGLIILLLVFALLLNITSIKAQSWDKHSMVLGLNIGAFRSMQPNDNNNGEPKPSASFFGPLIWQMTFQGEFAIKKYFGIGFTTSGGCSEKFITGNKGKTNLSIGLIANFHFYQLIGDNLNNNINTDKLDIYIGTNIGVGVLFQYYSAFTEKNLLEYGGIHAGIRYYINNFLGVNCEVGIGKSIVNAGFTFKV